MSERIAYQCNRDHILKFAGMEKLTGEQVVDELNRLYNTIAAHQQILNDLAEMLGVAEGDVDELIDAVDRLKEQHFTDMCNSADVKRLISVVAYPANCADQDFSEVAKRVLAKMEQNIKALAGGEAIKSLENSSHPASNSQDWGTVPYASDWVRTDRHRGWGGGKCVSAGWNWSKDIANSY